MRVCVRVVVDTGVHGLAANIRRHGLANKWPETPEGEAFNPQNSTPRSPLLLRTLASQTATETFVSNGSPAFKVLL